VPVLGDSSDVQMHLLHTDMSDVIRYQLIAKRPGVFKHIDINLDILEMSESILYHRDHA
jgi:hypothetical protein